MIRLPAILVTGILSILACTAALADQAPVNLCTGSPEGNYFATGRDIAAHANPRYVKVTVVATSGSIDNMERMEARTCGAGIVQTDAYVVYQARHRDRPVEVTRNRFLYAEFIHLVCRRDANVTNSEALLSDPGSYRVLVGAEKSGSALTWHAFTILDRRYGEIQAAKVGGKTALNRVLDGSAQCLFFVTGLGSKFAKLVDQRGKDLRLLPIVESELHTAEFGSVTLYEVRTIPKGAYKNLEKGLPGAGVDTLTVGATLVIDRQWMDKYPNGPAGLLGGVTGAMPAISARAMSGM